MVSRCDLAVEWMSVAWLDLIRRYKWNTNYVPWFGHILESNDVFTL